MVFAGDGAGTHYDQLQWVEHVGADAPARAGQTETLSAPGYGDASLGADPTAAEVQAALQADLRHHHA